MADKCPKCGAEKTRDLPAWIGWECGTIDWGNTPLYDRDNNIVGVKGLRQSAECRVRELEAENERLKEEAERLKRVNFELACAESKEERFTMLLAEAERLDWLQSYMRDPTLGDGWAWIAVDVRNGMPIRQAIDTRRD